MNWKKLTIGITLTNLLAWVLIEVWSRLYASSNVAGAAAFLIGFHLLGYYVIVIASKVPKQLQKPESIAPHNCPSHDWQKHKYSPNAEQCIKCGAERGV